jgi:hypothetical protein
MEPEHLYVAISLSQLGQSSVALVVMVSLFSSLLLITKHRRGYRWLPPTLLAAAVIAGGALFWAPHA